MPPRGFHDRNFNGMYVISLNGAKTPGMHEVDDDTKVAEPIILIMTPLPVLDPMKGEITVSVPTAIPAQ